MFDLQQHYDERLTRVWRRMPFILRITAWKDVPVPVLVVKEGHSTNGMNASSLAGVHLNDEEPCGTHQITFSWELLLTEY